MAKISLQELRKIVRSEVRRMLNESLGERDHQMLGDKATEIINKKEYDTGEINYWLDRAENQTQRVSYNGISYNGWTPEHFIRLLQLLKQQDEEFKDLIETEENIRNEYEKELAARARPSIIKGKV